MSSDGERQEVPAPPLPPAPPAPPAPPVPPAPPTPPNPATGEGGHHRTPHHISDIDTWKHPDRNYYIFVFLSVVFGLFGADHFYLRSYHTGMMKFISNLSGFGLWYFWDLIQIIHDGKKIREEGLTSPFDWICGIGRGVMLPPSDTKPKFVAEKSYLLYTFLAVFLGFLGLDKMYMGHFWQGLAKVFSVFNIFLFLFGFIWVLWDSFHALFMTKSILENGITAPLPYSFLFTTPIDGKLFLVDNPAHSVKSGGLMDFIPTVPIPTISYNGIYKDIVAPLMTPAVVTAINTAKCARPPELPDLPTMPGLAQFGLPTELPIPKIPTSTAELTAAIPKSLTTPVTAQLGQVTQAAQALQSLPKTAEAVIAKPVAVVESLPTAKPAPQAGGARYEQSAGPGPAIAGVLTAVVVAGGLKGFYDVISSQYG